MRRVHQDEAPRVQLTLELDEIARQGARKMLAAPLAEGYGGTTAAVLAQTLLRGLRAGSKNVLRAEAGLSPSSIVRLTQQWQKEREAFMEWNLSRGTTSTCGRTGYTPI
jgi:hypothetical protein